MLYLKKNDREYFEDRMEKYIKSMALPDQQMFVDLKIGGTMESSDNLFMAN